MNEEIKARIAAINSGIVPDGYKKTASGILPKEWHVKNVGSFLIESRIKGHNGDTARKITVKLWNRGVCEKQEIHQGSENTQYYIRKAGQLIYSKLDFLNCAFGIIPIELDGYESTLDLPSFDIKGIDKKYLLGVITQRWFYEKWGIMSANGGRKARRISPEDFLEMPIPFPPLPEQQKIAEILSTQDKLIELQEKKIEQLKELKKAYLQKMFPQKGSKYPEIRFKGFTEAWEQHKLGEVISELKSGLSRQLDNNDIGLPVVRANNINEGKLDMENDVKYWYKNDTQGADTKNYLIHKGDILINFINSEARMGTATIVDVEPKRDTIYTTNILKMKANGEISDSIFLLHLSRTHSYCNYIKSITKPAINQASFTTIEFKKYMFMMPNLEEQKKIGKFLTNFDHLITLHQRKLEQEKQKKKALMQLLLTGKVRVKI